MGQVLRPGDQVSFEEQAWTVTAVGSTVRLVDDGGRSQLLLLSYLLAAPGFELLDGAAPAARLEPVGLLEALPAEVVERARDWERHVIEVVTGLAQTRARRETDLTRPARPSSNAIRPRPTS